MKEFDLVVLGSGPGGYVAAIRGAQLGLYVGVVDKADVGGTCTNWGCIPTKALLASAELLDLCKRAKEFGLSADEVSFDLSKIVERKNRIVLKSRKGIEYLFKSHKIELIRGFGTFAEKDLLKVETEGGTEEVKGKNIIVATGSDPATPDFFKVDRKKIITSDEALNPTEVPGSMLIVGAGAIGCEFATIYHALGTKVTVVEMLPQLLPLEDADSAKEVGKSFKRRGIEFIVGTKIEKIDSKGGRVLASLSDGRGLEADLCLVGVGRSLNSGGIGLETIGVKIDREAVQVDDRMETGVPGVYAIGDVIGRVLLAHAASAQGVVAAERAAGVDSTMDHSVVPNCTYCEPEVASVGLTEAKAREAHGDVLVGRFNFAASGRASTMGAREGFVKLVADPKTKKLLGAHLVGPHVTEHIFGIAVAMRNGVTYKGIAETIHPHPTLSEAIKEAAEALDNRSIHIP
jgi:dihydrolipoamide dehydrogenase